MLTSQHNTYTYLTKLIYNVAAQLGCSVVAHYILHIYLQHGTHNCPMCYTYQVHRFENNKPKRWCIVLQFSFFLFTLSRPLFLYHSIWTLSLAINVITVSVFGFQCDTQNQSMHAVQYKNICTCDISISCFSISKLIIDKGKRVFPMKIKFLSKFLWFDKRQSQSRHIHKHAHINEKEKKLHATSTKIIATNTSEMKFVHKYNANSCDYDNSASIIMIFICFSHINAKYLHYLCHKRNKTTNAQR